MNFIQSSNSAGPLFQFLYEFSSYIITIIPYILAIVFSLGILFCILLITGITYVCNRQSLFIFLCKGLYRRFQREEKKE